MIWIHPELAGLLGEGRQAWQRVFSLEGEVYRAPPGSGRRTLRFEHAGRGYFLKLHWGVGWGEILKNLITLKRPVLGARNEWRAIQRLDELGVETMDLVAYGEQGANPATRRSFVITRELTDSISLEDYCRDWVRQPPPVAAKHAILQRVAQMTAALHEHGVNHRDLYICHFLLRQPWDGSAQALHLFLIDLHRVQIRAATPLRWQVKDLAALHYSSLRIGLTKRDLLRFVKVYCGRPLRESLRQDQALWQAVLGRSRRLQWRDPEADAARGDGHA